MKPSLHLFTLIVILAPASLFAQNINDRTSQTITRFNGGIDSTLSKPNITITSILPAKPDTTFPYKYQLLKRIDNKAINQTVIDSPYQYNMPIMKPEKTSKILIAKLDPNFPYNYNMPVKKEGREQ